MSVRPYILMAALLFQAGCSSYSFRITKPESLVTVISDVPVRVQTANLTYRMQEKENRLVLFAFNDTEQTIQLVGDRSFVVDPRGASHPVRSQAIAAHSYAKLILPPLPPNFQRNPSFQFGIGTTISRQSVDPERVRYLSIYEDSDSYYWDWAGESQIRLSLTFAKADGAGFTDEFTIAKVKAD